MLSSLNTLYFLLFQSLIIIIIIIIIIILINALFKVFPRIAFSEKVEAPLSGRSLMKNEIA